MRITAPQVTTLAVLPLGISLPLVDSEAHPLRVILARPTGGWMLLRRPPPRSWDRILLASIDSLSFRDLQRRLGELAATGGLLPGPVFLGEEPLTSVTVTEDHAVCRSDVETETRWEADGCPGTALHWVSGACAMGVPVLWRGNPLTHASRALTQWELTREEGAPPLDARMLLRKLAGPGLSEPVLVHGRTVQRVDLCAAGVRVWTERPV